MLVTLFFTGNIFVMADENPVEFGEVVYYKNQNPIDLQAIIERNISGSRKEEMIVEEVDMEYTTRYKNNHELPTGVVQVLQEGRVGRKNAIVIKKYVEEELISEEQVAENIITSPVERIVEIGTGSRFGYYEAKEGDKVYVVAMSVAVRLAPNENAEKICTLNKDDFAQVLQVEED